MPDTSYIVSLGGQITYIINAILVPVLFAVAFIVFIFGVAKTYILSGGEPAERAKGHKLILWGFIGFFVMLSIWGIVNLLTNTIALPATGAPLPQGPNATTPAVPL